MKLSSLGICFKFANEGFSVFSYLKFLIPNHWCSEVGVIVKEFIYYKVLFMKGGEEAY